MLRAMIAKQLAAVLEGADVALEAREEAHAVVVVFAVGAVEALRLAQKTDRAVEGAHRHQVGIAHQLELRWDGEHLLEERAPPEVAGGGRAGVARGAIAEEGIAEVAFVELGAGDEATRAAAINADLVERPLDAHHIRRVEEREGALDRGGEQNIVGIEKEDEVAAALGEAEVP